MRFHEKFSISDSNNTTQIQITVDPGKSDEENQQNGSEPEEDSSNSQVHSFEPATKAATGSTPKLFLRPSALSRDGLKPSTAPLSTPPSTVFTPSSKFSAADEPAESIFNIPSTADKSEPPKPVTQPIRPVTVPLANPDYVFGQNLSGRVVESVSNGTGSMLFSSVLNAENNKKQGNDNESDGNETCTTSLLEDAARCQEQRAAKRKYDEVQVTTGEEDEKNVLQVGFIKVFLIF